MNVVSLVGNQILGPSSGGELVDFRGFFLLGEKAGELSFSGSFGFDGERHWSTPFMGQHGMYI